MNKTIFGILILMLTVSATVSEIPVYKAGSTDAEIIVNGTSSLHDWHMILRRFDSSVNFTNDAFLMKSIDNVSFTCKVSDIKSDNKIMDRKAYDALKADVSPEIKFFSIKTTELVASEKKFNGILLGKLIVAGESRNITVPFEGTISDNYTVTVSGKTDLKMSDFRIIPPTAILGTLKTGDEITVSFSVKLKPETQK